MPLAAPLLLVLEMVRCKPCRISRTVSKLMLRRGSFILGWNKSPWDISRRIWEIAKQFPLPVRKHVSHRTSQPYERALLCKNMGGFCRKCRHFFLKAGRRLCPRNGQLYCLLKISLDNRQTTKMWLFLFYHCAGMWRCVETLCIRSEVRQVCDVRVV